MNDISGVINIYKEKNYTSHDVVAIVKKTLSVSKVGHTGTLDPAAQGVLPVCVGRATKLSSYIMAETKGYTAVVKLGICTDTLDDTGTVIQNSIVNADKDEIIAAVCSFKGCYMQTPPMYSAVKVNGKKLYELARKGKTVEREQRECNIYDITVREFFNDDSFCIDVVCSKGTYIRSLCADIGQKLGCGACMGDLLRFKSGDFNLDNSVRLDVLKESVANGTVRDHLIPIESLLKDFKSFKVRIEFSIALYNGNTIFPRYLERNSTEPVFVFNLNDKILLRDNNNEIVGIYDVYEHTSGVAFKPAVMIKGRET